MNALEREGNIVSQNDELKVNKKTNFIVTFAVFVPENNLWEKYARMSGIASEEEIEQKNKESIASAEKYNRGIPFLCDKISIKDGRNALIFYNQGEYYTKGIGDILKAERYVFVRLDYRGKFNIYFYKESHKPCAHFKNWDRKISEPRLKPLPFEYEKEDELLSLSSLFNLGTCEGCEKFKALCFDIDFSSLYDSIEKFENELAKLYPTVKTNPADKDYFYYAIEQTFDTRIGPACVTAMNREKNISIINNGELFEKGLTFQKIKRDVSGENELGLNPYCFDGRTAFIKTIAFFCIESGMWEKYAVKYNALSEEQIKSRNERLLKHIKEKLAKDKVAYTMLSFHNKDTADKTFVIYNMSLDYIQNVAKRALQESFVLLFTYYSDSFDISHYVVDGGIYKYFRYMKNRCERANKKSFDQTEYQASYIEEASITEIKCVLDFNEGVCKKLKSFGLNLDLSAFEGVLKEFDDGIKQLYPQVAKDGIARRFLSKKIYDSVYKTGVEDVKIINSGRLFCPLE